MKVKENGHYIQEQQIQNYVFGPFGFFWSRNAEFRLKTSHLLWFRFLVHLDEAQPLSLDSRLLSTRLRTSFSSLAVISLSCGRERREDGHDNLTILHVFTP